MVRHVLAVLAAFAMFNCSSGDGSEPQGDIEAEDQDVKAAPDGSHSLFVGKWESVIRNVPVKGELPFESNVRSLEFKNERDDSRTYTRYRLIQVIRPSCDTCRDETFPQGTYRSVATSRADLKKGKIYTTEGGNTSSRDFYEIDGDTLRMKSTGLGAENRTVTREFRRVR